MLFLYESREKLVFSPERSERGLKRTKATRLQDNYYRLQESPDLQELNRLLGIKWNRRLKFEEFSKTYLPLVFKCPVQVRADWDNTCWVNGLMATVVVLFDMVEVHRFCNTSMIVKTFGIVP